MRSWFTHAVATARDMLARRESREAVLQGLKKSFRTVRNVGRVSLDEADELAEELLVLLELPVGEAYVFPWELKAWKHKVDSIVTQVEPTSPACRTATHDIAVLKAA